MRVLGRKRRQAKCPHRATVTVHSAGIERVVCERCGHVSVHFLSGLAGEVERDRFARLVEREDAQSLSKLGSHEQPIE